MKLSISNIAWAADQDKTVYLLMKKHGYSGLEIAPTRIFMKDPYNRLAEAARWSCQLKDCYHILVSSMQSIWYGREEKIFGDNLEREKLLEYTKKAINFASEIKSNNLVFGCPKNRQLPKNADADIAIEFFRKLGDYAAEKGTAIGLEAIPPIYHTNYINDTLSALDLVRKVNSKGFLLNLDIGTVVQNGEKLQELEGNVHLINHVHISEPGLGAIQKRELHKDLRKILEKENYSGFISIEMGKVDSFSVLEDCMKYVRSVFLE